MSEENTESVVASEAVHVNEEANVTEAPVAIPKRKLSSVDDDEENDAKQRRTEKEANDESSAPDATADAANLGESDTSAAVASSSSSSATEEAPAPVVTEQLPANEEVGHVSTIQSVDPATGVMTRVMMIRPDKIGAIIGTKGAIVQEIQTRAGCKVLIDQSVPEGQDRSVTLTGNLQQIEAAAGLVTLILTHGPTAIHLKTEGGPLMVSHMEVEQPLVGRLIGPQGSMIRDIQTRSGAKIQINQKLPEGVPRKIELTGTQTAIQTASTLIQYVIDNGPHLPPLQPGQLGYVAPVMNPYGGGGGGMSGPIPGTVVVSAGVGGVSTICMEVERQYVGRIIGRGGEIVMQLQQKSGCSKVQIDQSAPPGMPCKVNITGPHESQAYAVYMINEVIAQGAQRANSIPSMFEAQGGRGGMGMGMGMGMAMGGMGGGVYGPGGGMGGGGAYNQYGPGGGHQQGSYGGMGGGGYGYGGQQAGMYGQQNQTHGGHYGGAAAGYSQHQQHSQQFQPTGYGTSMSPPAAPAASSPWQEHMDPKSGHPYWHNSVTQETTWDRPPGF